VWGEIKEPNHKCDPITKLFGDTPQIYQPSRFQYILEFQDAMYSGGKLRIQRV
jgi:hypothetical protein